MEQCVISEQVTITSDYTFPSTPLVFTEDACLCVDEGVTVTITGPISAPLYQIFKGEGKVKIYGAAIETVYPQWWGAKTNSPECCVDAFDAMLDSLTPNLNWGYGGNIVLPPGAYTCEKDLVLDRQVVLSGTCGGGWYPVTELVFAAGAGLVVEKYNPNVANVGSGDYSIIRNLCVTGTKDIENLSDGVTIRCPLNLQNVLVRGFGRHGIYIDATDSPNPFANPSMGKISSCYSWENGITSNGNIVTGDVLVAGDGLFMDGAASEASIITVENSDFRRNTGWGVRDWGNFGNLLIGLHTSINRGGPYTNVGGGSYVYNRTIVIGCYSEADQPPSTFTNAFVIGGHHGAGVEGTGEFFLTYQNVFRQPVGIGVQAGIEREAMLTVHGGYPNMEYARDLSGFEAAVVGRCYPARDCPATGVIGHGYGNAVHRYGTGGHFIGEQEAWNGQAYGLIAEAFGGNKQIAAWLKGPVQLTKGENDVYLVVSDEGELLVKVGEVEKRVVLEDLE